MPLRPLHCREAYLRYLAEADAWVKPGSLRVRCAAGGNPCCCPPVAPYPIPDSVVEFEAQLDPFDPALAYFDCGTDDTALAINGFFRGGMWTKLEMRKTLVL
jgi:hypothetical protein